MKTVFATIIFTLCLSIVSAQNNSKTYYYTIDLGKTKNDQFNVELKVPKLTSSNAVFNIPKTVPGTYSDDNYGFFVKEMHAFDKQGKELTIERLNNNSWKIPNSKQLDKLTYLVDDTFDDTLRKEKVFEPTGSNIQKDTAYVVNPYTICGFFTGLTDLSFTVQIDHPAYLYGATAMIDKNSIATSDLFQTANYHDLADNPLLYSRPDTTTIKVGGADILISVYSPNKLISSAFLARRLDSLTRAQVNYLGGKLPVNKYAYLIYLFDKQPISNAAGALEHSYSSMYSLSESAPEIFAQNFKDVAAHEFFHILTPLNVHSEQVQYFDFAEPKMSRHLWLYEGSTEYHAHKAQQEQGLIPIQRFLNVIGTKITNSKQVYKDSVSFTTMSKLILEPGYARQYGNVYEKGALINMCLDIQLRKLSGGRYGLINLIKDLSNKFGKGRPFADSLLFEEIGALTYPPIKQFLYTYVDGTSPLPLDDILQSVGIRWLKDTTVRVFSMGGFRTRGSNTSLYIASIDNLDAFGKVMNYQAGDTIRAINGIPITRSNYVQVVTKLATSLKEGEPLKVEVSRIAAAGSLSQTIMLEAPLQFVNQKRFNLLSMDPSATKEQQALRDAWLFPGKR